MGIAAPVHASSGDDYTADKTTTGAVTVGGSATGEIETEQDVDWFAVTLEAGKTYHFTAWGNEQDYYADTLDRPKIAGLYDSSGADISGVRRVYEGRTGRSPRKWYRANASGSHYIAVTGDKLDGGFSTGTYTLVVAESPADDCVAGVTTTCLVSVGGSITGDIQWTYNNDSSNDIEDEDWIRANLIAGNTYHFALEGAEAGKGTLQEHTLHKYLYYVNDEGEVAAIRGSGDGSKTRLKVNRSGAYYVAVEGDGEKDERTGTYTLTLAEVSGITDDFAADTTTTGTVTVSDSVSDRTFTRQGTAGTIELSGDVDWLAVQLEAGKNYLVIQSGNPSNYLYSGQVSSANLQGIYDSTGVRVANPADYDPYDSLITFQASSSGTYYIAAGARTGGEGSYRVTVVRLPDDDYSADTGTSGSLPVDGTATGTIGTFSDVDWFAVTLTAGKSYVFAMIPETTQHSLLGHEYSSNVVLGALYDSFGSQVASASANGQYHLAYSPASSGTYYIAVQNDERAYYKKLGPYTVSLKSSTVQDDYPADATTSATAVPGSAVASSVDWEDFEDDYEDGLLDPGTPATGNVDWLQDRDWIAVPLQAGNAYRFTLSSAAVGKGTLDIPQIFGLYSSDGTLIRKRLNHHFGYYSSDGTPLRKRLYPYMYHRPTESGTYYVEVTGGPLDTDWRKSVGGYRLTVHTKALDTPTISISGGSSITEGDNARFKLTSSAPFEKTLGNPLAVNVIVSQSGDYGVSAGTRRVTIHDHDGIGILSVATTNDNVAEANGSVKVTLAPGPGYTISRNSATVSVADNDTVTNTPEVSVTAGSDVTEGSDGTFTLTASPKPTATLTVNVTVSQSGDFGAATGAQTVTIPTTGTYTLTVSTIGDSNDEADGSVTVTVDTGTGYTVSTSSSAANVAVFDDDNPPLKEQEEFCTLPDDAITIAEVTGWRDALNNDAGIKRFNRVLATLGVETGENPMPADQAQQVADWLGNTRWDRIARTLAAMELSQCDTPPTEPEISIAAGADITEGGDATFTISATPTPSADLNVTVEVSQSGDYASTGTQTVTIPTSGSQTLTVGTTDDANDEADGSVTATISTGTGYTVSSSASAATVSVSDDDVPEISIAAGTAITEGSDATFTVTATPTPSADLNVTVEVSQSGDYTSTGSRTVTIPTTGSQTLTVGTTDDANDEADGSVKATISTGTSYTVSSSASAATVAVTDDDDTPSLPEISIAAAGGVTEGTDASYTLTATPKPAADLDVTVEVTQSGDFVTIGSRTVTITTTGTATLTVPTTNDGTSEADGSVTATISVGTDYTASTNAASATVAVSDNDNAQLASQATIDSCVSDSVLTTVRRYYDVNKDRAPNYGRNWKRVLVTFRDVEDSQITPFTAAEALAGEQQWFGWKPIREALECIEEATAPPPPPPDPEISIAAGSAITEGSDATFTVTATPAPTSALTVSLTVSQNGTFAATTGADTVTIPTTGSATFTVSTTNDSTDEPDGSVTATLSSGTGYTVSGTSNVATVYVSDDDDAPPATPVISIAGGSGVTEGSDATFTVTASPAPTAALTIGLTISQSGDYVTNGSRTVTIPISGTKTFAVTTTDDGDDEADGSVTATISSGTGYTVSSSASIATVAVSDDDDAQLALQATIDSCVSNSLLATVRRYYDANKDRAPSYGRNWKRVLITFGDVQDSQLTSFTAAEALAGEQVWFGWKPVREALECIEAAIAPPPPPPPPPSDPEISISAGTAVTEGSAATFTVTASPAPTNALTVNLTVSQSGNFGAATGTDTVIIPTTGSATFTVSTTNDSTDEPDGSVTATLSTGSGYTVSGSNNAATVAVSDDDDPPPATPVTGIAAGSEVTEGADATFTVTANPAPTTALTVNLTVSQSGNFGATTGTDTVTIPTTGSATFTVSTANDNTDEPDGSVTATLSTGTGYTVSGSNNAAAVAVSDDDDPPPATPVIGIAAGSGVTEGADATFTVTASPAPATALIINLTVSQSGNFGATTGADTVTIPTTGSATFTVSTTNDSIDEPEGSVTATLSTGTGYTVSGLNSAATVAVSDDDDPPAVTPTISVAAGSSITEGSDARFTVTASPTPTSALTVNLTISQSGSFGSTTGSRTITVPTSGSFTFTVSTTNDNTDEPNGSITATLTTGTGYTVSTNSIATVAVSDNDPAPSGRPTVTVSDASGSEADGHLTFTVTLSHANPRAITFRYGGFGRTASVGPDFKLEYREFTLNAGDTTLDIDIPIFDDNAIEGDETITIYVYATSGITIPDYFVYADGTIIDDDS